MEIEYGVATRAYHDQRLCGDGWLSQSRGSILRVMVADGIGHGEHAHQIITSLQHQLGWICKRSDPPLSLDECMRDLHRWLQEQGREAQAAVALMDLNHDEQWVNALVVGNIEVHCHHLSESFHVPSLCGMVGGRLPSNLPVSHWRIAAGALVGLYSDGLETAAARSHLSRLHEQGRHLDLDFQTEAETMVSRFGKRNDDAICALFHLRGLRP